MERIAVLLRRALRTGHGRPAALLLLGIMATVVALPDISPLKAGRLALFDAYQHWLPRERLSGPVSIVSIDEHALARYGQWPWPRTRLAELINRIAALGAVAIGLDIIMPESDRTSPEALAASLSDRHKALQNALSLLPHNDTVLADSLQQAPSVLGAAGFDIATPAVSRGLRAWPVVVRGGDALAHVHRYPYALASLPLFQAAASGQALLSADLERGVVRRVPLIHAVGDTLVPTLALEMLRVATGAAAVEVAVGGHGISAVSVGDLRVPTASNSEAWVHYSSFAPERYVSAQDILEESANPELVRNKLVIVALTGLGLMDYKTSARGEYVPGVEVHAQLIESFFDGRFLQRPWWMNGLEVALLVLGGFFLIWAMPKVKPRVATLLAAMLFVVLFGASLALFRWAGLLLDAVSVSTGVNLVFVSLLSTAFIEADRGRQEAQCSLQVEREAASRVAGELDAARHIQMGILPRAETAFPGEKRFELAAVIEPARAVGGDLYEFFMLDERRLFFMIGDVSGKGVPASLFMAISKSLSKSIALRYRFEMGGMLTQANVEIARDNPESLFVTALVGVLDVESGAFDYWNAGHDAPIRVSHGVTTLDSTAGGPPLCVLDDFDYRADHVQLSPADALVMFTDGVSEATDLAGKLYGNDRLAMALGRAAAGASAATLLATVRDDVKVFVGTAEPSDDLAVLVVRWIGPVAS